MGIILIAIGLLLTGLDFHFVSGVNYPVYQHSRSLGDVIQTYVTKNILGNQLQIDFFPDIIGIILILIGTCIIIRKNKRKLYIICLCLIVAILSVSLRAVPFYVNGKVLIVTTLWIYALLTPLKLWMEYLTLNSIIRLTDSLVYEAYNKRMMFGWWITLICRVFIMFLTFVGHIRIKRGYQVIVVAFTLFYIYHLIRSRFYVGRGEKEKELMKEAEAKEHVQ